MEYWELMFFLFVTLKSSHLDTSYMQVMIDGTHGNEFDIIKQRCCQTETYLVYKKNEWWHIALLKKLGYTFLLPRSVSFTMPLNDSLVNQTHSLGWCLSIGDYYKHPLWNGGNAYNIDKCHPEEWVWFTRSAERHTRLMFHVGTTDFVSRILGIMPLASSYQY